MLKNLHTSLILLLTMFFLMYSCSGNKVKGEFSSYSSKVESTDISIEGIILFDSKGLRNINSLPEEIKDIKNSAILFEKTNVTIISSTYFDSFNSATNSITKKMDVMLLIFSNFIIFDDGKESNREFLTDVNFDNTFYYETFKFQKSYIIVTKENNKKKYRVISIYTTQEEPLENFITSVWEDNCWNKSININITEKFIRILTSNYNSVKNSGKWFN
ncbi:MAG: hypothetical protein ACP5PT_01070 [Brevinematia bacterium]